MQLNSVVHIMLFDIILHTKMQYLAHYLDRNLIIHATWDGLFDRLLCIIVLSQTLFSFDVKGDIQTHSYCDE